MAKISKHEATDSALGYYYQGMFALLLLLDADDQGSVSIETRDDIEEAGTTPRLSQLKHGLGQLPSLSIKNDGFWNTLSIWIPHSADTQMKFLYITCADIAPNSPLVQLIDAESDRSAVVAALRAEAARVVKAVADAKPSNTNPLPYKDRIKGCSDFLNLPQAKQSEFVGRITMRPSAPNIAAIPAQVENRLTSFPKGIRPALAQRLIEWWDYRVARSLISHTQRTITKDELLDRLQAIATSMTEESLPDDFSFIQPNSLESELGSTMEAQIRLVDGGQQRILRAARVRWQARHQRDRWLKERIDIALLLDEFDDRLVQAWNDRHGPMCDDCKELSDADKASRGRELLDWTHLGAFTAIPPPKPKWNHPYLTQGSYQQLADQRDVGWHPDYTKLLTSTTTATMATT